MQTLLVSANCFNVQDTLECGQIFRYKQIDANTFHVFSQNKFAIVRQLPNEVEISTDHPDYFRHFFDLQTNYQSKVDRISAMSPIMQKAVQCGKGIRILNQDLTEMVFCFIISANNNIKRIQTIVERLCNALGEPTPHGRAFPTVQAMANAPVEFYTSIGAGYRDKFLKQTAQKLLTFPLEQLRHLPTDEARKQLLTLPGVGPKVADCILLFGMHRGDVFPVDTWLKKVYHAHFEAGHKDTQLSAFFCNLFGQDAGLCQQYLFYYQRKYGQNG